MRTPTTTPQCGKILYCRHHDLGYCEKHGPTPCFSKDCKLEEEPKATFCAICSGIVSSPAVIDNTGPAPEPITSSQSEAR